MQTAKRRRGSAWAIGASALAHAVLLAFLALQHPMLAPPTWEGGPPEPIIPVLILPRAPPPPGGKAAPIQPIRLHRRLLPHEPAPIAPLPVPPEPVRPQAAGAGEPKAVPAFHPAPQPEGPKGDLKTTLRQSYVGCANPNAVGLNKAERDLCDEKFGKGAKDAAFAGLGLNADKQRVLDAAGARKEEDYAYKRAALTPSVPEGSKGVGMTAGERCASMGVPPDKCGAHSGPPEPR